nr:bifunctional DNA primase/polymerase [Actinoplanes subtropicus]
MTPAVPSFLYEQTEAKHHWWPGRLTSLRAQAERRWSWFTGGPPGIGVICGAVSANLEMPELDGRAVTEGLGQTLVDLLEKARLSDLWNRITATGYWERTPARGVHILHRVDGTPVDRNLKLARRPATEEELLRDPADKVKTLAETRGEGGYTIVAPSHGTVHESRQPWVALSDSTPARIPTISAEERAALLDAVRALDQMPAPSPPSTPRRMATKSAGPGVTPGDDFERLTDWSEILVPAGWTLVHASGRTRYWRRPGKTYGISATTGRADDRDRLFVFSTSTLLESETPLTKFHVFAVLHHGGDHGAAARALRQAGYGTEVHPNPGDNERNGVTDGSPQHQPAKGPVTVSMQSLSPPAAWGPTEDGLARALVAHHGHELRYCPQRGQWLLWQGHRWVWDDAERHREFVRALARQLPTAGGWRRFRAQALSAGGVSGVVGWHGRTLLWLCRSRRWTPGRTS